MNCRQCSADLERKVRPFKLGRNVFCDRNCGASFALAEVPRLEAHLSKISLRARGMGRDLALQALFSNIDPT